jgi:hypothetical protein
MNSRTFFSFSLACATLALFANPLLASPLERQRLLDTREERNLAQTEDSAVENPVTEDPAAEQWADAEDIKSGFLEGCVGTEELAEAAATKQAYCQCAFEAYSGRYSPLQFRQINALASRMEADGPVLVNLLMLPELNRCSAETGFQI